jgi:hypothetical protein
MAWIFVLSLPRLRPIASSPWRFFGRPSAVLMSSYDRAIDHGVFIVRIGRQRIEDPFPNATLGQATMPRMHLFPMPEPLRQVPPGNPRSIAIEHRFNEQPIVRRRHANVTFTAWKQILYPIPLVVMQAIAAHRSASESA